MIFMTCSTVTPGFGVRIVSTPVILGCGGVDWPCARGARTVAKPSSKYNISIFIVQLLLISRGIWILFGTAGYHMLVRRSRGEKVTPKNKDNGTIRYQRRNRGAMATASMSKRRKKGGDETEARERIL